MLILLSDWKDKLKFDSITPLLSLENQAIIYFTKRDLLNEKVELYPDTKHGIKILGAGLLWLKRIINR